MRTRKPCAKLEDWAVVPSATIAAYQELRAGNVLVGKVFGHPTIAEGKFIFTSPIVRADNRTMTVETRNTAYSLGQASRGYQVWSERQGAAA